MMSKSLYPSTTIGSENTYGDCATEAPGLPLAVCLAVAGCVTVTVRPAPGLLKKYWKA